MKKVLMLLLMISIPIAYAGSDSEEEKSSSEKRGAKKHVAQMEEEKLSPSQLSGPQESSMDQVVVTANQDPDKRLQDLMAKISELEVSNTALKTKNKGLEENNQILSTTVQNTTLANQNLNSTVNALKTDKLILSEEVTQLKNRLSSLADYAQSFNAEIIQLKDYLLLLANQDKGIQDINEAMGGASLLTLSSSQVLEIGRVEPNVGYKMGEANKDKALPNFQSLLVRNGYLEVCLPALSPQESPFFGSPTQVLFDWQDLSKRNEFRQRVIDNLQPLEPYVIEDQAKAIRRLWELEVTGDQVNDWLKVYQDFYSQNCTQRHNYISHSDSGSFSQKTYTVKLEYKYRKNTERVTELMSKGYLECDLPPSPFSWTQESLSKRNEFRQRVIDSLLPFEFYVVEDQAKAIRRLWELEVTDDQVNDWPKAYQDFCTQGHGHNARLGNLFPKKNSYTVVLEYKYCKNTEEVIELISKGYYKRLPTSFDLGSPTFGSRKLTFDKVEARLLLGKLQSFEPYVKDSQADAIRRLVKLKITDDQVEDWLKAYDDFCDQVREKLEEKYCDNVGKIIELVNKGYYEYKVPKVKCDLPIVPSFDMLIKEEDEFRQRVMDTLQLFEPYVIEEQAKAIRRLRELRVTDDQVKDWIQAYREFCRPGAFDSNLQSYRVRLEYKYGKKIEGVSELISKGYYECKLPAPQDLEKQTLSERNKFHQDILGKLQPFEPYVIEEQAKDIRRLRELRVTDDQIKDWVQAYQNFYNKGYSDNQGTHWVKLEWRFMLPSQKEGPQQIPLGFGPCFNW